MTVPLRALLVEDSEDDALLIIEELRDGGYDPVFERVETREALQTALEASEWDIIIADYRLPNFSGLDALEHVCKGSGYCPFIIVSGQISEETAVKAMRAGAQDYVLKSNLARLVPAVERELREAEVRRQRREAEEALKAERERTTVILESITDAFYAVDGDWRFTYVNSEAARILGRDWQVLKGRNAWEEFPQAVGTRLRGELQKAVDEQTPVTVELLYEPFARWFSIRAYPSSDGLSLYFHDITDRKQAEDALAASRSKLEDALQREHSFSLLLQRALLPSTPALDSGYSVAAEYVPVYAGSEIGGDFYDVFTVGECLGGVLIGDVSGKGLEAAAMAATTRSTIHAFVHETSSAAEALSKANSVLCSRQVELGSFVTVFLIIIDLCRGSITYAGAGHPPAFICRSDGAIDSLEIGGLPLALFEAQQFSEHKDHLDPGDKLVMYTDGISEARHESQMLDLEGLRRMLLDNAHQHADELARTLVMTATEWAQGKLQDDAAVVVVERKSC